MRAHAPSERRGALVSVVVYVAAATVHAVTALLIVAAFLVLLVPGGVLLWLRVVVAGLVLAVALFVSPFTRAGRTVAPKLSRADAPTLFGLVDDVARETGAPRIECVEITTVFNASYSMRGVRRRRVLGIGMALWTALDAQQRVALIAHELGHAVNGDLRNAGIVHRAVITLDRWRQLLTPIQRSRWDPARHEGSIQSFVGLVETVVLPVVLLPLTALVGASTVVLEVIANRDGQRREYYADELAARVAGSTAAIELTEMLLLADYSRDTLARATRFQGQLDPWQVLREAVASIPATERERLRRNARRTLGRIDSTHPPTQLRADLLRARPSRGPRIIVTADAAAAIERELQPAATRLAGDLRSAVGV